jgi:hypothetical protein
MRSTFLTVSLSLDSRAESFRLGVAVPTQPCPSTSASPKVSVPRR